MQFQQDWSKDKKITGLLIFWPEELENFRSTELYDAPLEGSTIFLYRISLGRKSLESSRLGRPKKCNFRRTGCETGKQKPSKM